MMGSRRGLPRRHKDSCHPAAPRRLVSLSATIIRSPPKSKGAPPMRDLAELQTAMTHAIFGGDATTLTDEISAPGADALRRFGIYCNNMFLSLVRHLKAVF